MPFLGPIATVDNIPMLDGGISDPLPIKKAIEQGYENIVVVLTRNKGYRKSERKKDLPKFLYRQYPELRNILLYSAKD